MIKTNNVADRRRIVVIAIHLRDAVAE